MHDRGSKADDDPHRQDEESIRDAPAPDATMHLHLAAPGKSDLCDEQNQPSGEDRAVGVEDERSVGNPVKDLAVVRPPEADDHDRNVSPT